MILGKPFHIHSDFQLDSALSGYDSFSGKLVLKSFYE